MTNVDLKHDNGRREPDLAVVQQRETFDAELTAADCTCLIEVAYSTFRVFGFPYFAAKFVFFA